jgi:beta-lactamase regulating signal transducer with metallopeptidase domain
MSIASLAGWLLTVALQGGLFLGIAWAIERSGHAPAGAWRELMWRFALFGGVITASLQPFAASSPLAGRWQAATLLSALTTTARDEAPVLAQTRMYVAPSGGADASLHVSANRSVADSSDLARAAPIQAQSNAVQTPAASDWPAWIVGIWIFGAALALLRRTRSLMQLHAALRHAAALSLPGVADDLAGLARHAAVHDPQLFSMAGIASPIAVAGRRIILPTWATERLDRGQLHAMLAHELAHLARLDPQWKLLIAFWRALFWFLPLASVAQRRLDDAAELACDAFAAQQTGNARNVAECLAACAEHHVAEFELRASAYELAPAMAVRKSSVMHRIDCLLEGVSMQTTVSRTRTRAIALVALATCALSLPAITFLDPTVVNAQTPPAPPAPPAVSGESNSHWNISIDDEQGHQHLSVRTSDANHDFRATVDGKITFRQDESDVATLDPGGTASFEEKQAGVTHRLELAARGDKLERRYFVDQHEQPFDAAASAWFAHLLPTLIRESGIGAQDRVRRIYAAGGATRVLDEIDQISSDYVRGIYLKTLMDLATLTPADLDRTLAAAGKMHSDYERRQTLGAIFAKQTFSPAQQMTLLHQVVQFHSDYERAELLVSVAPKLADDAHVRQAWLDAALGGSSDYERRRTLESMLTRSGLDDSQLTTIIQSSASMSSDYERRTLLVDVMKRAHDVDALAPAYAHSTQSIHSDYERREALLALIRAGKLGTGGTKAVLDSAADIHSDYECREVLVALAQVMPADAGARARYHEIAGRLSPYDRDQAEQALPR